MMAMIHKYSVRFDFLKALSMTFAVLLHLTPCMLLVVSEASATALTLLDEFPFVLMMQVAGTS
jgi:hypothetical protein